MEKVQLKKVCGLTLREWESVLKEYEFSEYVYMCHCGDVFNFNWQKNHLSIIDLAIYFIVHTKNTSFIVHNVFLLKPCSIFFSSIPQRRKIRMEFLNYIIKNFENL